MNIRLRHQHFELHPYGAVYWMETKTLLISDVHLGKISHFRRFGNAVPSKAIPANFIRLSELVGKFLPERIFFLGDLFHSGINMEWEMLAIWLNQVKANVVLIEGNHDIISPRKYEELGVKVQEELLIEEFLLTHHPNIREGCFNICGHVHPGIILSGLGRQRVKLPCFFRKRDQLILPSFGTFTGHYIMEPGKGESAYAITQKEVFLI